MTHDTDIKKRIWVVEAMAEYASFYDEGWAQIFSDTLEQTKLDACSLDLIFEWKGAAYTAAMPWSHAQKRIESCQKVVEQCLQHIRSITGLPVQNPVLSAEGIWSHDLQIPGFKITLWSSQRICYGAIYHAYENFLGAFMAIAMGKPKYRPTRKNKGDRMAPWEILKDDLNGVIPNLGETCLGDQEVILARLTRNALAHNGGRSNPEIEHFRDVVLIHEGFVQVRPADTRKLFNVLKGKVLELAKEANNLPQFMV